MCVLICWEYYSHMLTKDKPQAADATPVAVTFDHVSIAVPEVDTGIAWYGEKFGARLVDRWADAEKGMERAHIAIGELVIELVKMPNLPPQNLERKFGYHHFAITVPDCDALVDKLKAQGVTVMFPPSDFERHKTRWTFVRDGYGNVIEIISYRK